MNLDWMDHAACHAIGVVEWFGPEQEPQQARTARNTRNRNTCTDTCTQRAACAVYALALGIRDGVYAGADMSNDRERTRLRTWLEQQHPEAVVIRLPKRREATCGTIGGFNRHKRLKETPCLACRDAYNTYSRRRQADARQAKQVHARLRAAEAWA